jgi:hypothetical protein
MNPIVYTKDGFPTCDRCTAKNMECTWRLSVIKDRIKGIRSKMKSYEACAQAKLSCLIPRNSKEGTKTSVSLVVPVSKRPRPDDEDTLGPSKRPKTVDEVMDEDKEGEEEEGQLRAKVSTLEELVDRLLKATAKVGEEMAKQRIEDLPLWA